MKVILMKDVKSLGKKGDIVEVSDGYGRNFILPSGTGIPADKKNLNTLKLQNQNAEKIAAERLQEAKNLKERIDSASIVITIKAGKEGKIFGSISSREIQEALKEQAGIDVDKKKIDLDAPIKNGGEFAIPIKLHKDVMAKLQLKVETIQ